MLIPAAAKRIVLRGGTVVDPVAGTARAEDVAVVDGVLVRRADLPMGPDCAVVDCASAYVLPGLVDCHAHAFAGVSTAGAPESAFRGRGVVAVADAGSAGPATYAAFQQLAEGYGLRLLCYLNVSAIGLLRVDIAELGSPDLFDARRAHDLALEFPDVIRGFKMRLARGVVRGPSIPMLRDAIAAIDGAGLPLMVHIGDSVEPLSEILAELRPGDIVTHCYTGQPNGLLVGGRVIAEARRARQRGILFDCAHGSSNFSFAVARAALAQDFPPDTISSDQSPRNRLGPVFDLATTLSKLCLLGMDFPDAVRAVTRIPADILGIGHDGYGRLAAGGPARVTVARFTDDASELTDSHGERIVGLRLEPLFAIDGVDVRPCDPWPGGPSPR